MMTRVTEIRGGAPMSDDVTVLQLTESELATGTIKSVSLPGDGQTTRIVQVRIPPGVQDGTLLRVPAPGGDVHFRITTIPAAPTASATPTFSAAPPPAATGFSAAPPPTYRPYSPYQPPARSRRRLVLLTGAAAAVVVVVVALITANSGGGSTDNQGSQQAAPPAPTTTTAPPESAATYQQALNGLATALTNGLTELNNAQTPQAISTAATDFGNAVQQAEGALGGVPPVDTEAANTALMSALQGLTGGDLSSVGSAASSDQVCLGPAATALLSRSDSLAQLRTAIAGLTTGGLAYQFGATLPPVTQDGSRSANTGSIVAGAVHHGLGELTISNGGTADATVGLVAGGGAPVVTVYVGQGGSYTLRHIADGTYTIYVTSGADWDAGARLFSRGCQFQQFDQTMDFTTTSSQYTTYTITLTPVADGNATESGVDPGSFPH
jgi:hypothetical protein